MAKQKKTLRSLVLHILERKKTESETQDNLPADVIPVQPQETRAAPEPSATEPNATEPTGSCRYADGLGQIQCESPVVKSYCDEKSGFFTPDGRC